MERRGAVAEVVEIQSGVISGLCNEPDSALRRRGDYTMEKNSRELSGVSSDFLDARWFHPIEVAIRDRVRGFIEELVEAELDDALGRSRYQRPGDARMTG